MIHWASERNVSRFVVVVFVICLAGLWFCSHDGRSPGLCLVLSLFLFLIAPGFIPALRLKGKLGLSFLEALPFSICLSLGQAALLLLACEWLGLSISGVRWVLPFCTLGWFVWAERRARSGFEFDSDGASLQPGVSGRDRVLIQLALFILVIAVFVLLLNAGAPLRWDADSAAHLSAIRGVMEEDRVFPTAQPYGPNASGKPDPRFGVFHALCALLVLSSGVEIHTLWRFLPSFLAPFVVLAFFFAARSITGSTRAALVAAILFPICYGGIGGQTLRIIGYPSRISMLVYLVSLGVFFRYFFSGRRWLLLLLGALVATTAAIHAYYFIEFVFVTVCFLLVKLAAGWDSRSQTLRRWTEGIVIAVGVSMPLLIYRFLTSYSMVNPYAVEEQKALYLGENLYILNPLRAYSWLGLAGVVSIFLLPYFISRARQRDSHAFIVAATAGPLLFIFNPVLLPLASKVLSYLAWRLMWAVPYVLSLGIFLSEFPGNIRAGSVKARLLSIVGVLFVIGALLGTVAHRADFYRDAMVGGDRPFPDDLAAMSEIFGRLDSEVGGRRVFLSDPVTAYAIPAFTRHFVTAIPVAHAAPTDPFPVSRVREALDVLNPGVSSAKTLEVLRKYEVEFVAVNTAFREKLSAYEYEIDPEMQRRAFLKISSSPALFEEVFSEGELHVFRVIDLEDAGVADEELRPVPITEGTHVGGEPIAEFAGLFSLETVEIVPVRIEPGDSVRINSLWTCLLPLPSEDVYKLFVRLETDFPKGTFFNTRLEKPYRKLLERRLGRRFRFKEDIDPHSFERPLHLWKEGEIVRESIVFGVPEDLFPGRYRVGISLRRTTPSTNYHVSDYLSDEDYYSGVEVGTVDIGTTSESKTFLEGEKDRRL